jgi:hypothetical protein
MKHLEPTLATYMYNYCNMCNIPINIHMKHLQLTSETSKIIETYACNMHFQRNISLLLRRMEARRRVEFTRGSSLAVLVGGGGCMMWKGSIGRMTWKGAIGLATRL